MVRKTHSQFLQQMQQANKNIEIISKYEKDNVKVKCRCKRCKFEWGSTPSNLLRGKGCKQCHFNKLREIKMKSHENFIEDIQKVNENIEILSKYHGVKNKVDCKCLIHNERFSMSAGHLLSGEIGCKKCIDFKFHISGLKSHKQFVNELFKINKDIEVIGKYDGAKKRIEVKCLNRGHIWYPIAYSLLQGYGCPYCKRSKGEERIKQYLITNNIKFVSQKKFTDLKNTLPLSYDFYLPKYNLLIEYQGQFHDGTASMVDKSKYFERQQKNDKLKRDYANSNNYNLLEIWYYDFDNIENIIDKFIYNLKNPVTTTVV